LRTHVFVQEDVHTPYSIHLRDGTIQKLVIAGSIWAVKA